MEKYKKIQDMAEDYFNSGYNCCESVVLAACSYLGIDCETPLRIATPFGSGMSRNGVNCGALSAAFIMSGAKNGRKENTDERDPSYLPADRIYNMFKERFGTTQCFDITKVNLRDPDDVAKNKERMHGEICGPIVRQVTEWIIEELEK
ncbi:MAG: C-GCAxxG-C-C family protein [Bacillota bacterium]